MVLPEVVPGQELVLLLAEYGAISVQVVHIWRRLAVLQLVGRLLLDNQRVSMTPVNHYLLVLAHSEHPWSDHGCALDGRGSPQSAAALRRLLMHESILGQEPRGVLYRLSALVDAARSSLLECALQSLSFDLGREDLLRLDLAVLHDLELREDAAHVVDVRDCFDGALVFLAESGGPDATIEEGAILVEGPQSKGLQDGLGGKFMRLLGPSLPSALYLLHLCI